MVIDVYDRVGNVYPSGSFVEKIWFSFAIIVLGIFDFVVELRLFFLMELEFDHEQVTFEHEVIRYLYWYAFRCVEMRVQKELKTENVDKSKKFIMK